MTNVSGANNRMALDQATILRLYVFHSRLIALYQKETRDAFHLAETGSPLPSIVSNRTKNQKRTRQHFSKNRTKMRILAIIFNNLDFSKEEYVSFISNKKRNKCQ